MNEEKTPIEKVANMNLEGLLLPEPNAVSYWWIWLVMALLVVVVLWALIKKYRTPKATALRELKQLHKDLKSSCVNSITTKSINDTKSIKKQIARSLRQGFNVTRLDILMPNNMQWRDFLSTLETTLYSNQTSETKERQELSSLITSAQSWLKNS